ncbi:uncharacterized protein ARMOST_15219 [Armillaria ostoyae]|uniref:Uncharacterized protein n=1 Tax=Armillaria ostoyae TaxID=47428 RepID=A0A284RSS9_ARMOS|nr:uncharacterized protein ARMOST_15219 [Armillaria ostoyae]
MNLTSYYTPHQVKRLMESTTLSMISCLFTSQFQKLTIHKGTIYANLTTAFRDACAPGTQLSQYPTLEDLNTTFEVSGSPDTVTQLMHISMKKEVIFFIQGVLTEVLLLPMTANISGGLNPDQLGQKVTIIGPQIPHFESMIASIAFILQLFEQSTTCSVLASALTRDGDTKTLSFSNSIFTPIKDAHPNDIIPIPVGFD